MKRITVIIFLLMLLSACRNNKIIDNTQPGTEENPLTTQAPLPSQADGTLASVMDTPAVQATNTKSTSVTATQTLPPSSTLTPIPLELTGNQAYIEKVFKQYGFQFAPPTASGNWTSNYGWLNLRRTSGDQYDMDIWIDTVTSGYSLHRAHIGFCFFNQPTENDKKQVQNFMHELLAAAENDWAIGPAWVDSSLPELNMSGRQNTQTYLGEILIKLYVSQCENGLGYGLLISADPQDKE